MYKRQAEKIADIVKGIADGCKQSGSALVGGETAEMPGFYGEGEYDMAGFSVGIVDKDKIITGAKAVSYTHLDVYKRQAMTEAAGHRECIFRWFRCSVPLR